MKTIQTTYREIRHFHLFAGLGGGAAGFNAAQVRVGTVAAIEGELRNRGALPEPPAADAFPPGKEVSFGGGFTGERGVHPGSAITVYDPTDSAEDPIAKMPPHIRSIPDAEIWAAGFRTGAEYGNDQGRVALQL